MANDDKCIKQWQEVLDRLIFSGSQALECIENLLTEEELIRFFTADFYRNEILKWIGTKYTASSWKKSEVKAKSLREEGNKKFQSKDFSQCLCIYTDSIKYAPVKSEELSLSLANRSAVLLHMSNYEGAIIDIELALAYGYPQHLQYKLHQRKAECLVGLKKFSDAVTEFNIARDVLQTVKDMPEKKKSQISKSIENALSGAMARLTTKNKQGKLTASVENVTVPLLPVPLQGFNEDLPFASKALGLRESKEKGRHVVAHGNISVGDVLFVEKPFAWVLLPENYQDRCQHCCSLFRVPVPCCECTTVWYCSESCRKDSWKEYHKWECYGGLDIIHNVGIAHLGLRVVLKAGSISELKTMKTNLEKGDIDKNEHYVAVYNLVTHLEKMSAYDRAAYALTAVCLMLYLDHYTEYFHHSANTSVLSGDTTGNNDETLLIGCYLLHHICQLVCNGHAITAIKEGNGRDDNPVVDEHQIRVATAIYPSASMMNHSCDSNIINSFFGTHLIVKAYKNIKKGQEVFNCYGPHFRRMSREQRKEHLKSQYFFECQCENCLCENDFLERFTALLCEVCDGPLPLKNFQASQVKCSCGSIIKTSVLLADSRRAQQEYQKAQELMKLESFEEALRYLHKCYGILRTCFYKSHIERRECLDSIAKCYAQLGDFVNAAIFIERTLPAIEEQYGAWSIEMAHELSKLTDVLLGHLIEIFNDKETFMKKHAETMKYVQKAKEIFELHYGDWNPALEDVKGKENYLNEMLKSWPNRFRMRN